MSNNIACIYFEGNDSKVAIFKKENNQLTLIKAESIDSSMAFAEKQVGVGAAAGKSNGNGSKDLYNYNVISDESTGFNRAFLQKLNEFFFGQDLSKCKFIPILCEPAIYFQKVHDEKDLAGLNINAKGKIDTTIGFLKLSDNSSLAVYPSGKSNYLQAVDSLAKMNNRRLLKIPTVKSAEVSLATYVTRKFKLQSSHITLVLYTGKEYSKLIFLKGEQPMHISSTISVGKNSFNAHNVIVSKILLEMEHAGTNKIDRMIICGEDESEEFINTVQEAYPLTIVSKLKFKDLEVENVDSFSSLSSFTVPITVAEEYFDELDKKVAGINLLPNYIRDEQKLFHFSLPSYLMMILIFASAFYFSYSYVANQQRMKNVENEIGRIRLIQAQNQETVNKIKSYENKIQNVDKTRATLNQLSSGTGVFSFNIKKVADFVGQKRNMWINNIDLSATKELKISGYTLFRPLARQLNDSYNSAILNNVIFEPLRDYKTFKFLIKAGSLNGGDEKK